MSGGLKKLLEKFFDAGHDLVIDEKLIRALQHGIVPPPYSRARFEAAVGVNGGIKDIGRIPIDDKAHYQDLPGSAVGFATIQTVYTPPNDRIPGRMIPGAFIWSNSNSPTYWGVDMNLDNWADPNATEPGELNNVDFILPVLDGLMGWVPFPGSGVFVPNGQSLNYRTQLVSGHRITATLGLGWRVP